MYRVTIYILVILCRLSASLGDRWRATFGAWIIRTVNYIKIANIPSSDIFNPDQQRKTVDEVRAALDKPTANRERGGWQAAADLISVKREQAVPLLTLPREIAITILMGMEGQYSPKTSTAADDKIEEILEIYQQSGRPRYLYELAHAEAVKLLKEADKQSGYLGAGCLGKLFATRINTDKELGERIREQAVLLYLQHNDELKKFLKRDEKGNYSLPTGNTFEDFATSMLCNAYGDIPE